jgi:cell division protein FtsB
MGKTSMNFDTLTKMIKEQEKEIKELKADVRKKDQNIVEMKDIQD